MISLTAAEGSSIARAFLNKDSSIFSYVKVFSSGYTGKSD